MRSLIDVDAMSDGMKNRGASPADVKSFYTWDGRRHLGRMILTIERFEGRDHSVDVCLVDL